MLQYGILSFRLHDGDSYATQKKRLEIQREALNVLIFLQGVKIVFLLV